MLTAIVLVPPTHLTDKTHSLGHISFRHYSVGKIMSFLNNQVTVNGQAVHAAPRILDLHADFACANCGMCCRHNWNIHVSGLEHRRVVKVLTGSPLAERSDGESFCPAPAPSDPHRMALRRDERGWCVFAGEETDSASYCQMQRATSLQALPETCQSYPRMAVSTPAGLYITLMYTCPAAVRTLLRENALGEVSPRGVMAAHPCLQGVKILPQAKPPLLSQACAGQWEAFNTFWRWTVRWMAQPEWTPAEALYLIGQLVEQIEARGQAVRTMEGLTDVLEQFAETPAERFRSELSRLEPLTELGLVYLNILLNMLEASGQNHPLRPRDSADPAPRSRVAPAARAGRAVRPAHPIAPARVRDDRTQFHRLASGSPIRSSIAAVC